MSRPRRHDLLDALFAQVRREADRRRRSDQWSQKAQTLRAMLMPIQARLESDPARYVSVRAARRTGKSTGTLFVVAIRCLEHAEASWVVIGLTRQSVKRIYWGALQKLNEVLELGIKFQHQELVATFPNGSRIFFTGAETVSEIEKLRGGKYDGAVIDECKSYGALVFRELVDDVLSPALLDRAGQLFVIGTPGDDLAGPFYLSTCDPPVVVDTPQGPRQSNAPFGTAPEHPSLWSLHSWSLRDNVTRFRNPRTGEEFTLWEAALAEKAHKGYADDNPTWRREFLGQWVPGDVRRVYRYYPHRHDYRELADTRWGLPAHVEGESLLTCVGWDFGSRDGTAAVVWAWSPARRELWEVYSEKRAVPRGQVLAVSDVARWHKDLANRFGPFAGAVADPAGLATMVIDTLAAEHGVVLEAAEKREKLDHIQLMNDDLDAGLIRIRAGSDLSRDLLEDRWLEKSIGTDRKREDPSVPNDVADAALYGFRWCRHRLSRPADRGPDMYSREWWDEVCRRELADAERRARASDEQVTLDLPWWEDRAQA